MAITGVFDCGEAHLQTRRRAMSRRHYVNQVELGPGNAELTSLGLEIDR